VLNFSRIVGSQKRRLVEKDVEEWAIGGWSNKILGKVLTLPRALPALERFRPFQRLRKFFDHRRNAVIFSDQPLGFHFQMMPISIVEPFISVSGDAERVKPKNRALLTGDPYRLGCAVCNRHKGFKIVFSQICPIIPFVRTYYFEEDRSNRMSLQIGKFFLSSRSYVARMDIFNFPVGLAQVR
jgi:hypothetical protein